MRLSIFDLTRFWAMITGLVLALWYFASLYADQVSSDLIPMLITAIGGFELVLYGQDVWYRRRGGNG